MSRQTIFRNARPESGYTALSNRLLHFQGLSLEARGFQAYFLSQKLDWRFNMKHAREKLGIGETKAGRIMKELKAAGFIRMIQERNAGGTMGAVVYEFTDVPHVFNGSEPNRSGEIHPAVDRSVEIRGAANGPAYKEITGERNKVENTLDKPQAACPSRSQKLKANKVGDEKSGYLAFSEKYKAIVRSAGRKSGAQGLSDGRRVWASLTPSERNERYSALLAYGAHLKSNGFKNPQHIDRFLRAGWEDFFKRQEPEPLQSTANAPQFHPVRLEAALEYARKPDLRGISASARAIFAGASQIPADLFEYAKKLAAFDTDHLAMTA